MTDTPEYIKELQLKLWLARTPGERLLQFLTDNDIMFQGILAFKKGQKKNPTKKDTGDKEGHQQNR